MANVMTDEQAQAIAGRWFIHGNAPECARKRAEAACQRYGGCSEVILAAYAESAQRDWPLNISPEAQLYFAERPHVVVHQDPDGQVWEKAPDPWHPDAFKGCGPAVESVVCSRAAVAMAGERKEVWHLLDWWGNTIGTTVTAPTGL